VATSSTNAMSAAARLPPHRGHVDAQNRGMSHAVSAIAKWLTQWTTYQVALGRAPGSEKTGKM
jgi:hypothetical protein